MTLEEMGLDLVEADLVATWHEMRLVWLRAHLAVEETIGTRELFSDGTVLGGLPMRLVVPNDRPAILRQIIAPRAEGGWRWSLANCPYVRALLRAHRHAAGG